jgi:Fe-S cluster assembly scaffold protein SufB
VRVGSLEKLDGIDHSKSARLAKQTPKEAESVDEDDDDDFDPFAEDEGDDEEAEKLKAKLVEQYNAKKSKSTSFDLIQFC